jgi:excisionase family DNA binding protein
MVTDYVTTASRRCPGEAAGEEPVMTLLTVDQAAERLATKPRFIRRLIAERRIPYVKLGAHVRLHATDVDEFIAAGRVDPEPVRRTVHRLPAIAPSARHRALD